MKLRHRWGKLRPEGKSVGGSHVGEAGDVSLEHRKAQEIVSIGTHPGPADVRVSVCSSQDKSAPTRHCRTREGALVISHGNGFCFCGGLGCSHTTL